MMWLILTSFVLARNDASVDSWTRQNEPMTTPRSQFDGDLFAPSLELLTGLAPPFTLAATADLDAGKERLPIMLVTGLMGTALDGKYTNREGLGCT